MQSIFTLFHSIIGYLAIITIIFPVIASIVARRKGVKFDFDLRIFEIFVYVAAIGQLLALLLAFTVGIGWELVFLIVALAQILTFSYLLLKWMNKQSYFKKIMSIVIPLILIVNLFLESVYPAFIIWLGPVLFIILAFLLSYNVDKNKIRLPKEYSYIHIGIYLYSIVSLIGITPSGSELSSFGSVLQHTGSFLTNYYFYRSFRCLYP